MIEYYSPKLKAHVTTTESTAWLTRTTTLPAILIAPIPGNSISMVRALKQIKDLLETSNPEFFTKEDEDRLQASIEDVEFMLQSIK